MALVPRVLQGMMGRRPGSPRTLGQCGSCEGPGSMPAALRDLPPPCASGFLSARRSPRFLSGFTKRERSWAWTPGQPITGSAATRRRRASSPPTGRSPTELPALVSAGQALLAPACRARPRALGCHRCIASGRRVPPKRVGVGRVCGGLTGRSWSSTRTGHGRVDGRVSCVRPQLSLPAPGPGEPLATQRPGGSGLDSAGPQVHTWFSASRRPRGSLASKQLLAVPVLGRCLGSGCPPDPPCGSDLWPCGRLGLCPPARVTCPPSLGDKGHVAQSCAGK